MSKERTGYWTQEDDEFLLDRAGDLPARALADEMGVSRGFIMKRLAALRAERSRKKRRRKPNEHQVTIFRSLEE